MDKLILITAFIIIPLFVKSQDTIINRNSKDTIIYYFRYDDLIKYLPGNNEPDSLWTENEFDDSSWLIDTAVIGFGYGESRYTQVNPQPKSIYTRFSFDIKSKETIKRMNLVTDFDDGYIAYLNGIEIARVNVDKSIKHPPFDALANRSHTSEYLAEITSPVLGIYLDSALLSNNLVNGKNTIAIHLLNDGKSNNSLLITELMDISHINKKSEQFFINSDLRYKRLVDIDSTNIPIVSIETDLYGIPYNKTWTTANLKIINNNNGKYNKPTDPSTDYNGLISIKLRGQSSRDFAKQSYRFELINEDLSDTSISILGMPEESDWILSGPFADKSLVRNKFVYDLASKMEQYAPRSRFCELNINDQPVGLYLLTEEIKRDKNRVNISKLDENDLTGNDLTGGYLFKYDKAPHPAGSFIKGREIVYPDPENLIPEQSYYIKRFFTKYDSILMKTNDFADPEKGFRKYASDSSLVDFFIINEITKNADSYLTSTYMYKDRDDIDGRMKFGPVWDYDLAFSNTSFQKGNIVEGWQFEFNSNVMNTTRYFQDAAFVKLFQKRWHELRKQTYSNDSIFNCLNELIDQIELGRIHNYQIWPVIDQSIFYPGYYTDSYENEILIFKEFLTKRLEWIDNNIDNIYYPLVKVNNDQLTSVNHLIFKLFPNPFTDNLTLSFNIEEKCTLKSQIYDINGRLRFQQTIDDISGYNEISFQNTEISNLEAGVFFIRLFIDDTQVNSYKIIKR
ncbi:MAG: CotH kinase family protein [Candidatus Cloacimonetes bacterium]|nr:CotH kinase family protein [Candidatus Cloacimonadota bacterium]